MEPVDPIATRCSRGNAGSDRGTWGAPVSDDSEGRTDHSVAATSERIASATWRADHPPTLAVIDAVESVPGRDADAMRPLYDFVDGDALDGVLESARERDEGLARVVFEWEDLTVVAESDGTVEVWRNGPA